VKRRRSWTCLTLVECKQKTTSVDSASTFIRPIYNHARCHFSFHHRYSSDQTRLMPLTPTKRRTLPRQRSSPSLNVGLPPPLPDGSLISSTSHSIRRIRSHHRIHRGDVSSSAASSDDDLDPSPALTTPIRAANLDTTPKRRVVGIMEPMSVGRVKASSSKRPTLSDRLQAVAKIRPSRSIDTFDQSIPPVPPLPSTPSRTKIIAHPRDANGPESPEKSKSQSKNDKVVVCVRSV